MSQTGTPLVSVITVVYNGEKTLERTILSVAEQTYVRKEHVIIDGLSTDGTTEIIKKYEENIAVWISEKDDGLYDAMNKGIQLAKGGYLLFLNAGDVLYDKNVLKRIFEAHPDRNADIYYGDTLIVDAYGNNIGRRRLKPPENLSWKSLNKGMVVSHQAFFVRKSITPVYDLTYRFSADFDWMIRALKQSRKIINTGMVITRYLDGGLTKKHALASLKERFMIMCKYYGTIKTLLNHIGFGCRSVWFFLRHGYH